MGLLETQARLKRVFFGMAKMVLGKEAWDANKAHLMPKYNPWEQRLCVGEPASLPPRLSPSFPRPPR